MAAKPTSVAANEPCRDREDMAGSGPRAHKAGVLSSGQLLSSRRARRRSCPMALQPLDPICAVCACVSVSRGRCVSQVTVLLVFKPPPPLSSPPPPPRGRAYAPALGSLQWAQTEEHGCRWRCVPHPGVGGGGGGASWPSNEGRIVLQCNLGCVDAPTTAAHSLTDTSSRVCIL